MKLRTSLGIGVLLIAVWGGGSAPVVVAGTGERHSQNAGHHTEQRHYLAERHQHRSAGAAAGDGRTSRR